MFSLASVLALEVVFVTFTILTLPYSILLLFFLFFFSIFIFTVYYIYLQSNISYLTLRILLELVSLMGETL